MKLANFDKTIILLISFKNKCTVLEYFLHFTFMRITEFSCSTNVANHNNGLAYYNNIQ